MKKIYVNSLEPSQQQLNNLLEHYQALRYEDAEKLSLSITQEFPIHPFAWKVLAVVLKLTGRISESLVASQKSVQLDPRDAEAHNNLGILLKELGKLDEAEKSYKKAIELKPDYAEAHNNLGNVLKELGKLDEA
ncbi:tetratricopeptide repeat protein, partial [bacterium]|nr:tetratricopeptide repeat protein [bacterium]